MLTDAEYRAKRQSEINKKTKTFEEVAGRRTPEDCKACGNEACIKAWEEQNELWPEEYEPVAYRVSTVSTGLSKGKLLQDAQSRNCQELENSQRHSQGASGIGRKSRSLFDLRAA